MNWNSFWRNELVPYSGRFFPLMGLDDDNPSAGRARLDTLVEGTCVQIMYFGASDPRMAAPEKNKTILRQSVRKL